MEGKLRKVLAACVMLLVAASVLLAPSNAAAMIECVGDQLDRHVHQAHGGHDDGAVHSHHASAAQGDNSALHVHEGQSPGDEHCANHACLIAIAEIGEPAEASPLMLIANIYSATRSLVALASPDGLRRPPRL